MKRAVVLRHAERQDRTDDQSHLSQVGIEQARKAGSAFERFDLVVTSPLPRAVETAIAMGFAVSKTHPGIQDMGEPILAQVRWDAGFAAMAEAYRAMPLVRSYIDYVAALLGFWIDEAPDGGSLLVVTHGGIVEALAVGLCPEFDWTPWSFVSGYVEGFEAVIDPSRAPAIRFVRS